MNDATGAEATGTDPTGADAAGVMAACAAEAVGLARERFAVDLDYSIASVKHLDRILDRLHRQIPRGLNRLIRKAPPEDVVRSSGQVWGAYLGEVIRKQWGGAWSVAEDGPFVGLYALTVGGRQLSPPARPTYASSTAARRTFGAIWRR